MIVFRNSFLFLCLGICSYFTHAQTPDILWQQTIGGSDDDRSTTIEQTVDGGFIIGGSSTSDISGEKTQDNWGAEMLYDFWVLKLDEGGSIEWQQSFGGNADDHLMVALPIADGGYIIGGSSNSLPTGNKTVPLVGNYDYWILKLDAGGNILWQKGYGSSESDVLNTIQPTSDGGFIVGGISGGDISGDKTDDARGDVDYWILKLDSLGELEWQKTIGGNKEDYLFSAFQTADGGFMVGGSSKSLISGERTLPLIGTSDLWFLKLDSVGSIIWQKAIGSNSKDRLNALFELEDGGFILGAYSAGGIFEDKTEASLSVDFWILKLDASGDIIWQNTIGSNSLDLLNTAKPTPDGGCIAIGSSNSAAFFDKSEPPFGGFDYWAVKVSATGMVEWDKTLGGIADDEAFGVCVTADDNYLIAGYSNSGISGNKTGYNRGAGDYWLVKLGNEVISDPCDTAPIGLYADNLTPVSAKLHWTPDPDALKYLVRYRTTGTPGWTVLPSGSASKNISGLSPSTSYEFAVRSYCGPSNKSGWSASSNFLTTALRLADTCESAYSYSIFDHTCEISNTTLGGCGGVVSYYWEFCGDDPTNIEQPIYHFTDSFCICLTTTFADGTVSTTCTDTILYTGIQDQLAEGGLIVYPNPAADIINIDISNSSKLNYSIYAVWGLPVLAGLLSPGNFRISIGGLSTGMYYLQLEGYPPVSFVKQ